MRHWALIHATLSRDCLRRAQKFARFVVRGLLTDCLAPGGTILVSAPFVWRVHAYPSDYFRFTVEGVRSLFPGIEWDALELVVSKGEDRVIRKAPVLLDEANVPHLARCEVYGFGRKA
jgi:hypothetical protein